MSKKPKTMAEYVNLAPKSRPDLLPPQALLEAGQVMAANVAEKGNGSWRDRPREEHLAAAQRHLLKHQAGDTSENHLANAACRILMAMETV